MKEGITENITSIASDLDPYGEHSPEQNYQAAVFLYEKELTQEAFVKSDEFIYFYNQFDIENISRENSKLGQALEEQSKKDWDQELRKYASGEESVVFPGYMSNWVSALLMYDKSHREDPYSIEPPKQIEEYITETLKRLYADIGETSGSVYTQNAHTENRQSLKKLIDVMTEEPTLATEWYKLIRSSYIEVVKGTDVQVQSAQQELGTLCSFFNKGFRQRDLGPRTLLLTKPAFEDVLDMYYPFELDSYPTAMTLEERNKQSIVLLKTDMEFKIGETGFPELRFAPVPDRVVFHETMHAITNPKVRHIETKSGTLTQVFNGLMIRNYLGETDLGSDPISRNMEEGFTSLVEIFIAANDDLDRVEALLGRRGFPLLDENHTAPANLLYDKLRFSKDAGTDQSYYHLPIEAAVFNRILSKCGNPNLLFSILSEWANSNGVGIMEYDFATLIERDFQKEEFLRLGITRYSRAMNKQLESVE